MPQKLKPLTRKVYRLLWNSGTPHSPPIISTIPKPDTLCTSVKPIAVKGEYAMETRGLWKMEHDAMGGPFVSHSRVDTLNNRVVVAEGFVYAPEKMKRGLIRRLEAALYTLCLPGEQARELKASIPEVSVVAGKEQE